ncbi:MAG: 2Fe-2S iron-sulfur cluster-binding protein [Desulfobacterales bacterium]|nr:2Fe-2S iron-sulfur cluster-binding protein [Desulfobacterales bacterium]MDD4394029.1 2Fe-2S iron-sulfur cluster-binding protein [Desulfobacterales bacterium]
MIDIYINDNKFKAEKDAKLIEVCREHNIYIPSLCYHPALPEYGGCRLCLVELRKGDWSKLVASCAYPIRKTEYFYTDTEKVKKSRMMSAQLLLARAPEAKPVIENILREPVENRFEPIGAKNKKCVLCGLCYRACHEQGTAAIYTTGRGADKVVETPYREANEDCIGCFTCSNICPTGAIKEKMQSDTRSLWHQSFDLLRCPICGRQHITKGMVAYEMEKTGLHVIDLLICPRCRQQKLGRDMLSGFTPDKSLLRSNPEYLHCPVCGDVHITRPIVDYIVENTGLPEIEILVCPTCREGRIGSDRSVTGILTPKKSEDKDTKKTGPLHCPVCGEEHITSKVFKFVRKKTGFSDVDILICPKCRLKKLSRGMLTGFSAEKQFLEKL